MPHAESDSIPDTNSLLLDEFGITAQEAIDMRSEALKAVSTREAIRSRKILEHESPDTSRRIAQALRAGWLHGFSKAGHHTIVGRFRDHPDDKRPLEWLLTEFLVDPLVHPNVAAWCLTLALQESSAAFQLDTCPSPKSEGVLSGYLLKEISSHCEKWARVAEKPLKRTQTAIVLRSIDLSILGGEQVTGGDIGLVLHFEGTQARQDLMNSRIIPLIFQAKRYVRPRANVSQRHPERGSQHGLLARNKCASAYLFFENGTKKIDLPLPPLIKPVDRVASAGRTVVFEDSLDLPSYFFKVLYDVSFATPASSPEDALRMIYSEADIGQLSRLAVISDSATASLHYDVALETLRRDIERERNQSIGGLEL